MTTQLTYSVNNDPSRAEWVLGVIGLRDARGLMPNEALESAEAEARLVLGPVEAGNAYRAGFDRGVSRFGWVGGPWLDQPCR